MIGRLFIMAGTIWASTRFLPGVAVSGGIKAYLWIAVLFSIINALLELPYIFLMMPLGFLPKALSIPALVAVGGALNGGLLVLVANFTHSMWFDSFGSAFLVGVAVSIVRFFISPSAM